MTSEAILLGILLVLLLLGLAAYAWPRRPVSGVRSGLTPQTQPAEGAPADFACATWFFVSDWTTGAPKTLMRRGELEVRLGGTRNDLEARQGTRPTDAWCSAPNAPLQRWAHVLVSVLGRTMDVYIDGKLVRTCVLSAVPRGKPDAPLEITPGGQLDGWTAGAQSWNKAAGPQQAWDLYRAGRHGANYMDRLQSWLADLGGWRLRVKVERV